MKRKAQQQQQHVRRLQLRPLGAVDTASVAAGGAAPLGPVSAPDRTAAARKRQRGGDGPAALRHILRPLADSGTGDLLADMRVLERFVDEPEEQSLLAEIEPYLKRLRYEFDHWDDAIHGYRETERKHWYPANRAILDRVVAVAFDGAAMPYVHVLDLAEEGVIKPHVDSVRYCGNTIAGISLLSDSVMRLVRTNDEEQTNAEYRQIFSQERHNKYWADILLPRRSLYVMRHTARYKFTHEILPRKESLFRDALIPKTRRISIICRNDP